MDFQSLAAGESHELDQFFTATVDPVAGAAVLVGPHYPTVHVHAEAAAAAGAFDQPEIAVLFFGGVDHDQISEIEIACFGVDRGHVEDCDAVVAIDVQRVDDPIATGRNVKDGALRTVRPVEQDLAEAVATDCWLLR